MKKTLLVFCCSLIAIVIYAEKPPVPIGFDHEIIDYFEHADGVGYTIQFRSDYAFSNAFIWYSGYYRISPNHAYGKKHEGWVSTMIDGELVYVTEDGWVISLHGSDNTVWVMKGE